MPANSDRIAYLLSVCRNRRITAEEEEELFALFETGSDASMRAYINDLLQQYRSESNTSDNPDWDLLYEQIITQGKLLSPPKKTTGKLVYWLKRAAAVLVFVLASIALYYWLAPQKEQKAIATTVPNKKDIDPPQVAKATLILGNGHRIVLDSSDNGTLATIGNLNVVKLADGSIAYKGNSDEVQYNTLSNPRGSKVIDLTLSDGTRVWLNAASSIRYPSIFRGSLRTVEITGEAYFEVAHNPQMPFIVKNNQATVKVLGTHFNVNAYDDASTLNVTLLEGRVSVNAGIQKNSTEIIPGEQARVSKSGTIQLEHHADLEQVMAWKNGMFSYKGESLNIIMSQVQKWYDVNIIFEQPVTEKFYAEVPRNTAISTLLKMLEATKAVQFRIEDKNIYVSPGKFK